MKTLTGKEIEIDIESDDTISRIKERVEEKEGIPPPQQRLIFGGSECKSSIAHDMGRRWPCEHVLQMASAHFAKVVFHTSNSTLYAGPPTANP